jgi:hypothetical protein
MKNCRRKKEKKGKNYAIVSDVDDDVVVVVV